MIFFTADTHFGHNGIISFCKRPFKDTEEMDKVLIRNWNYTVSVRDEVYILGDFTMCKIGEAINYLYALNGKKYLVRGNHDKFIDNKDDRPLPLEWVKDYYELKDNKQKFILFHYPISEWSQFYRGSVHLYGHVHQHPFPSAWHYPVRAFNVGVDVNDYRPVCITEIIRRAGEIAPPPDPGRIV